MTVLIAQVCAGDESARERLFACAYSDLRQLARARLRDGGRGTCLGTTALVHEAYLRFLKVGELRQQDRRVFFAYASQVMRSVIVDAVRERQAQCRDAGASLLPLDSLADQQPEQARQQQRGIDEVMQVHEALQALARVEPRLAQGVEMRYFGGFSEAEIALAQEVTERTVRRDWEKARLLLTVLMR